MTKPRARGYVHQAAFFVALCVCIFLLANSHGTRALVANIIYSVTLTGLFGISAIYHVPLWSRPHYLLIRSIDHAAIFALIAGTATPICILGIKGIIGFKIFSILWIIAFIGMLLAVFWNQGPKWLRALLYIAMGWISVIYFPELKSSLGITNLWLLLIGGIIYTVGALIYAFKYPNPYPHIFGYHEIFHIFVVIASGFHFMVIYNLTVK